MMTAFCDTCGTAFDRKPQEAWRDQSGRCYRAGNAGGQDETQRLRDVVRQLRDQLARQQAGSGNLDLPDRKTLTFIAGAVHPDRHQGDERATKAAQWVLDLRDKAKRKE